MSLYKQFWLLIILLLVSVFVGGFIFSCIATRNYLETHLTQKNNDNALTIALSLSSGDQDEVSMELAINSQFDLGHYHFISLADTQGKIIAVQYDDRQYDEAPGWLMRLFPITINPGVASVSRGWQQVGTLTLSSHDRFAYKQLWDNAKQLFYYFVLILLVFYVFGSMALRWLNRSLTQAVEQARAIADRRFISTKEPRTPELRELIRSLNKLSEHVRQMLASESSKLEHLRQKTQYDEVTGLYNRGPLLKQLGLLLQKKNTFSSGALILVRIDDLFNLNQNVGRQSVDRLLIHAGRDISKLCSRHGGQAVSGRLNGSDFLLILPTLNEHAEHTATEIYQSLTGVCREHDLDGGSLITSSTVYSSHESITDLLTRLDEGLQRAAKSDASKCFFVESNGTDPVHKNDWQQIFTQAFANNDFVMDDLPVLTNEETLLHWKTVVTLRQKGKVNFAAFEFSPHVARLGLNEKLDMAKIEMALASLRDAPRPLAVSLSSSTLADTATLHAIAVRLSQSPLLARYMNIEFPEHSVVRHFDGLIAFSQQLLPLHCKIGIAQAGHEIEHVAKLHNLGLQYVKIDAMFTHEIHNSLAHQAYIRGFCTVLHTIGMQAIAEGVTTHFEWEMLQQLGIDGGCGDFFTKHDSRPV